MIRAFTHTPPSRGERSLASQSLVVVGQRRLRRRVARVLSNRDGRRLRRRSAWVLADIVLGSWHISHPLAGTSPSAVSKNFLGPHPPAGTPALGAMRVGKADCLQPCCTQVQHPTRRTEGGQREREGESGQEEKTIARLTGEKTVRHDRVAVVAFLSSRRSSVNVATVVVQHVSLVIVAVVVVFVVVVRLGSWPMLCLSPGTYSLLIHPIIKD